MCSAVVRETVGDPSGVDIRGIRRNDEVLVALSLPHLQRLIDVGDDYNDALL